MRFFDIYKMMQVFEVSRLFIVIDSPLNCKAVQRCGPCARL